MKQIFTFFLTFISLLVWNCASAEKVEPRKIEKIMKVQAGGGLRLRIAPNIEAKKIDLVPDGDVVETFGETGEVEIQDGKQGRWVKVKWKKKDGYVFGGFLEFINVK
ncbi:SH3 domain-containing protein [Leptospira licerasiae]|uniref:SH3 domain protein n=1 Tax=Leptospira licerasiae str. MMD4847 TaxID=1049971 RepID=A0ABN0H787_9LEPT|nr:SH3 domain-containing protein [Leptospira licerasiae]EIE03270.1 bacterial SH3 domain protein [Leptospira licerasiae serovar Varillal str. VAR 010]EJZ41439.1 SH3 domain protein [Leptospira licerasiae str. MMD4847]TGM90058.1 SH3 domain-containing protein [Leptospira licerasiae]